MPKGNQSFTITAPFLPQRAAVHNVRLSAQNAMGHHHASKHRPLRPQPLQRSRHERRGASQLAIQRATFQHFTALVDDPKHPGGQISYADLEQRMRARSYQLALSSSRTCSP